MGLVISVTFQILNRFKISKTPFREFREFTFFLLVPYDELRPLFEARLLDSRKEDPFYRIT